MRYIYDEARFRLAKGELWDEPMYVSLLSDGYHFDPKHSSITAYVPHRVLGPKRLSSVVVFPEEGQYVYDAADVRFEGPFDERLPMIRSILVHTPTLPVAYTDEGMGLPYRARSICDSLTIAWDNGPGRIFSVNAAARQSSRETFAE